MDTVVRFRFDWRGKSLFEDGYALLDRLGQPSAQTLGDCLGRTMDLIREYSRDFYYNLVGKRVCLRVGDSEDVPVRLRPHDILLNRRLLVAADGDGDAACDFLVANIERAFYHLCHPLCHISQVRLENLHFVGAHPELLQSAMQRLRHDDFGAEGRLWLAELREVQTLLLLERFWKWFGEQAGTRRILAVTARPGPRARSTAREVLLRYAGLFAAECGLSPEAVVRRIAAFRHFFVEENSAVFVYRLGRQVLKAARVCRADRRDAWSGAAACASMFYQDVRTDLFHDHGHYIGPWLEQLKLQSKDYSFEALSRMLQSEDLHTVNTAVDDLADRIRHHQPNGSSLRLLYAALYYWHRNRRDISRAVDLRVGKILEDVLTERPASFPPSRVNRSIFRGEPVCVQVQIQKPYRIARDNMAARVQWAINGHRKKPVAMELDTPASHATQLVYRTLLPRRTGWIHYAVQISHDGGKTWHYEKFDSRAQGLLKSVADERGQRVLSFYCDTFNLKLDADWSPVRDAAGAYVYGTFDDLAAQLPAIRAEGYTRIYPLGALELGWAGEAGPDPSVFSIWDGRTVRRDMGGLEGLLRLQAKAKELGMKVLLDVVSHFSRANAEYPYDMPVYIADSEGRLARRAGWDGEWDEWRDSFMVNMRDFENVERLAVLCEDLTRLGFGLRFDVGHGFDTVFPVDESLGGLPRTLGQVVTPGFEPMDLRGTWEPNIAMLYICYRVQKSVPQALLAYSEQWHGNEARMIKSGTIPYNAIIKNLENMRSGQPVDAFMGLNDNLAYVARVLGQCGGQTLSLFNTHDEEAPASNYQNMIWPAAAFLVFSSCGPLMYHISRLPDERVGSYHKRFDMAYNECWKHWVNNRFTHPWAEESRSREAILSAYPLLRGVGAYLRALYNFVDAHPALTKGMIHPVPTNNDRIAAFIRSHQDQRFLCVFNFPNPVGQGQQAVMREFNFPVRFSECRPALEKLQVDAVYEFRERYNNVEGRMRRGRREYWSGEELTQLGFGGVLAPVSSRVYEIIYRDHAVHEKNIIPDSFVRYFRYGKDDRVKHSYIALAFRQAIAEKGRFERFAELFTMTVAWLNRYRRLGIGELALLLAEISEAEADRSKVVEFLLRIAVNETEALDAETVRAAVSVLQSLNIGTLALVSPESRFSGSAGGVGIYTTDIADVLSELGFHVVIVTPLYECDREGIIAGFNPRYEGHSFSVQFPSFDDSTQTIGIDPMPEVVNLLRSRLTRVTHGKRSRVDVLYLENAKYFDRPYGGSTSEDKLRRARLLSQGALEALRCYNYYPAIIQMNEWPTWLVGAYLTHWSQYREDPHFAATQACSMMHNPHPAYSIVLDEYNPAKRDYYCRVIGLDPAFHWQVAFNPESHSGHELDLMHVMLMTSQFVGTVSKAMRQRILDEPWLFGHARLFTEKARHGRFFARRNGFNMAARQRFWFGTKRSILETYDNRARRRLFRICLERKGSAKLLLQSDPRIRLTPDDAATNHVIFGMLHRISQQKGFELLVDWKVYAAYGARYVRYEPWNMNGPTMLEYFLSCDPRVQFVICGRVEDSPDGRRFDMHFHRIAGREDLKGRFAYLPQGALPPSLYRNLYIGSQYFVMPSGGQVGEPCGISQQEAHAGGTPVIAHHQDGLQRTVCDKDFGDTAHPTNGIKFTGFNGEALLEALLDGVEIYYHDRRRRYAGSDGQPKRLRYQDMCFNAFHTDHRWLRLLHDYIDMYAEILGAALPTHLDAARLISEMQFMHDGHLGDVVLKKGMDMPWAVDALVEAMGSEIVSLRRAAAATILRLSGSPGVRGRVDIRRRLQRAAESGATPLRDTAGECLKLFEKQRVQG
ncbi:MAG: glycogen/starch synthase [Phycisphaerae bacterium]|nr:glycogen/starch synthase [Phycisphaerae bacterium]